MVTYFKKNIYRLLIIIVLSAAAAVGLNTGARIIAERKNAVTFEERLNLAVKKFESAEKVSINADNVPAIGIKNTAAHFTVFFDYTCSHCKKEFDLLKNLIKKYPDNVKVSFKFLPLNGNCRSLEKGRDDSEAGACIAAEAAYCAFKQGKFVEYSDQLFDWYHVRNNKFTSESVTGLAKSVKLDMNVFLKTLSSQEAENFIAGEYTESEKLGIETTPTVYLNGRLLDKESRKADILEGLVQYCIKRGE